MKPFLKHSLYLPQESDTIHLAQSFANTVRIPLVITFSGEIGTGKTTFIRALLRALGISGAIKSPTFSLVETYPYKKCQEIHHFDLYRIHDPEELAYIGYREYFHNNALSCIEWPERMGDKMIVADLHFSFSVKDAGRILTLEALSLVGNDILYSLMKH